MSPPRLVIREHRPYRALLPWLIASVWIVTLAGAYWGGAYRADPKAGDRRTELRQLRGEHADALEQIRALEQQVATLERSEQVERDAARALQTSLAERDAELATLRNDVAFFERLAGGSGERQPLAAHSLSFEPIDGQAWRYLLILTQNLKKAVISKGTFTLRVEGSLQGALHTVEWGDLLQTPNAEAQSFAFKYFQQIEGSITLPADFTPHRVRVLIHSDQGKLEQTFPWSDSSSSGDK